MVQIWVSSQVLLNKQNLSILHWGLKPSSVEQAKFEYSLLGKIFNKGLDEEDDKKEGLLKRLKNIEMNQKSNNNDKSELSCAKSELSLYTPLIGNDETQTSFEYLKGKIDEIIDLSKKF